MLVLLLKYQQSTDVRSQKNPPEKHRESKFAKSFSVAIPSRDDINQGGKAQISHKYVLPFASILDVQRSFFLGSSMDSPISSVEGPVCPTCGADVFTNASIYCHNCLLIDHDQVVKPFLVPVWRGSFVITETHYDVFEGFRCHCSIKTGKKVHDEATTLPPLLSFELHSRALLWPNSFFDAPPSDKNIAIYLFPGDTSNKQDFEQLVSDMIDEDLAMKTDSRNAELLIFTSKALPQEYWRFQGSYCGEFLDAKRMMFRLKTTIESHSPHSPLCTYR